MVSEWQTCGCRFPFDVTPTNVHVTMHLCVFVVNAIVSLTALSLMSTSALQAFTLHCLCVAGVCVVVVRRVLSREGRQILVTRGPGGWNGEFISTLGIAEGESGDFSLGRYDSRSIRTECSAVSKGTRSPSACPQLRHSAREIKQENGPLISLMMST